MNGGLPKKNVYLFASIGLITVAFIMRLWGLTSTSLWYDEVFVLTHAQQGPLMAVSGMLKEDNALPLHGLLTALWVTFAGSGEFSARYLSLLLGTVTTPLVMRLSGELTRTRYSGYGSGLAYATLPIFVYYTQEVRMYALAIPLATTFAWLAIRLYRKGKNALLTIVVGMLMLSAHIYTGLMWAVCLVWGLIGMAIKKPVETFRGQNLTWLRANGFLILGSLPIAGWAIWRVNTDATATSAISMDVIKWIPVAFGIGQYSPTPWAEIFIVTIVLSLCAGFITLISHRYYDSVVWIVLSLALPISLLFIATLVKAKWSERYLLPSFGLGLVTGVGLGWEMPGYSYKRLTQHPLRIKNLSIVSLCLLALWLAGSLPAVKRQTEGTYALVLRDEWHPRPDFRGVAQYIEAHDTPEDAIVVVAGYAAHTLAYYYKGPALLTGLPVNTRLLNTKQSLDLNALQVLEQETRGYSTLWLVLWQQHLADPTNLIESNLVASCKRMPVNDNFTNIGVLRFDLTSCRPLDQAMAPPVPLTVDFTAPIQLNGYEIQKRHGLWEVDLWWKSLGILDENYTVFVHLVNSTGEIIAQHDHIAGSDAYPTSQWREGTYLRNRFFLEVPGDACAGCVIHIGLYTGEYRLALKDGQDTIVLEIDP